MPATGDPVPADPAAAPGTTGAAEDPRPAPAPRPEWAPLVLAVAMEAAWISVVAGLVQEYALRAPAVGLVEMAAFVASGVAVARLGEARLPREWPAIGTALVFIAAVVGLALEPAARTALGTGNVGAALAENPGGLFAGVAVLRGYAHAGDRLAVDTVGRALFLGIPVLAIAAAMGGVVAEPWHSGFLRDAAVAATVFIAAGLLTLALAALADIRQGGVPSWRTNPVWTGTVVLAVGGLLAIAIAIGLAGGPSIATTIQAVVAGSIVPLAIVGLVVGGRAGLRRLLALIGGTVLIAWLLSFAHESGPANSAPGSVAGGGGGSADAALGPAGVAGISGLSLVVVGVAVFLLIRAWMRRQGPLPEDLLDVRSSDLPSTDVANPPIRRHRRRPWTPEPRSATEAYLALVEDLHDEPDVRRKRSETPTEHARRVRLEQVRAENGIGLELLAADYGLATYGGRSLSIAETRRAIGRWRSLRRLLRVRPADAPSRRSAIDDVTPPMPDKPSRPY